MIAIERLAGQSGGIEPERIEREFDRIWRESTAGAGAEGAVLRLRVLNLIAVGGGSDAVDRFEAAMQVVPLRHPCRAILVVADSASVELSAAIGSRCWRTDGGARHVCSEELIITGPLARAAALSSATLPMLVPDLPVSLWLMDAAPPAALVDSLVEEADRVLFDSALGTAASGAARRWQSTGDTGASDLAWERTAAWRDLTAQAFDGAGGRSRLDEIRLVELTGRSAECFLYAGWFVSRLGLPLADVERSVGSLTATYYAGTRPVRVRIAPADAGGIARVRIDGVGAVVLERHVTSGHIHVVETAGAEESRRVVEDEPGSEAELLAALLDVERIDATYRDAVRAADALLE